MRLLKACNRKVIGPPDGFTLIEIIIVLGLFGLISSLGLIVSLEFYNNALFHSEKDQIISMLYQARSRAMNNINQNFHGACYDDTNRQYVVFEGEHCQNNAGQVFPAGQNMKIIWPEAVIFSPQSGRTSGNEIILTKDDKTQTIFINYEGGIDW